MNLSPKFVIGLGAIALGIVLFLVLGNSSSETTCELTAGGAGIVTEGILHNHGTTAIVASLGTGIATESACKEAVKKLVNSPDETVPLKVEEAHVETSGYEVQEAVPEAEEDSFSQDVACFGRYLESEFLFDLCTDGIIE